MVFCILHSHHFVFFHTSLPYSPQKVDVEYKRPVETYRIELSIICVSLFCCWIMLTYRSLLHEYHMNKNFERFIIHVSKITFKTKYILFGLLEDYMFTFWIMVFRTFMLPFLAGFLYMPAGVQRMVDDFLKF